jgi:hypothetical protein
VNVVDGLPTPLAIYRERFTHLRGDFHLHERHVTISGTIGGSALEATLPLDRLVPEFGLVMFRPNRFYLGLALFLTVGVFTAIISRGPPGLKIVVAGIVAGLFSLWGLAWAIYYFPKRVTYRFINDGGIVVLDFVADGPDRDHARDFAEQIALAIRNCQRDRANS